MTSEELRDITMDDLDDIWSDDQKQAEDLAKEVWNEVKEFLKKYNTPVEHEVDIEINTMKDSVHITDDRTSSLIEEIVKSMGSSWKLRKQTIDLNAAKSWPSASEENDKMLMNDNRTVFATLVHEGNHASQWDDLIDFNQKISQLPFNGFDVLGMKNSATGERGKMNEDYCWAALEGKKGDRVSSIIENTVSEYKKWSERYEEARAELKNTDLGQLHQGNHTHIQFTGKDGQMSSEEYLDHIYHFRDCFEDLYDNWDISDREYEQMARDHVEQYENLRDDIKENYENKKRVVNLFKRAIDDELDLNGISDKDYGANFSEAFTCFLGYCTQRGELNDDEVRDYLEDLNGYAEFEDASKLAEEVFTRAMETTGSLEDKINSGMTLHHDIFNEGKYVLES